ncbi:MAG TPA: GIY-YIG nuclease family protein [Candidatus Paceibacterota bacterium]|nr:GIY-YIG nuclease family protein [Candidatus Paceibacterota bacterium]
MKTGIIYCAENLLNGKRYIGQTVKSLAKRKSRHHSEAFIFNKKGKFYDALRKYGWDNFSWHILENIPVENLDERESYWIAKYRTLYEGYNMTEGGPTLIGHKHTEETKKKISDKLKGKSMRDVYLKNYGEEIGIQKYEEYIQKLNSSNGKGRTRLELFIERNGEEEGKRLYNEFVEKIREARRKKGSTNTITDFQEKYGIIEGNKKYNEFSNKMKSKKDLDETKIRKSLAKKKYWEEVHKQKKTPKL